MILSKTPIIIRQNRRSLSLMVRDGEIIVKAPQQAEDGRIYGFIKEREAWLLRALARDRIHVQKKAVLQGYDKLMLGGDYIDSAPALKKRKDKRIAVIDFYRHQFNGVRRLAAELSCRTGLMYTGDIRISYASTFWGLCKNDGQISINFRLSMLPKRLQEYVIVHELTHIQYHNHSPAFWAALELNLPDARRLKKELKSFDYLTGLYRKEPTS